MSRYYTLTTDLMARLAYQIPIPFYDMLDAPVPGWGAYPEHAATIRHRVRQYREGASLQAVHERWRQQCLAEGWQCLGPQSYLKRYHPHLKPWDSLTTEEQLDQTLVWLIVTQLSRITDNQPLLAHELITSVETVAEICADRINDLYHFGQPFKISFINHAMACAVNLMRYQEALPA
jgi:hypothetical protein